ncbi:hypothetical protein N7535_005403 [Penicillium sp. DV-2018c]|nr:hypothetical protein N7535_005403 [Penicillium sp. DV-2018c]
MVRDDLGVKTGRMQRKESVAQKEPRNTGGLKSIKGLFFSFSIPVQYHQSGSAYPEESVEDN